MFERFFGPEDYLNPVRIMPKLSMAFNPLAWNEPFNEIVQVNSNCLAYALDEPKLGFPFIHNLRHEKHTDESFINYKEQNPESTFEAAGLEIISPHQYSPDKRHIFAYWKVGRHFFRLDGDKIWSQKNATSPAVKCQETLSEILNGRSTSTVTFSTITDYEQLRAARLQQILQEYDNQTLSPRMKHLLKNDAIRHHGYSLHPKPDMVKSEDLIYLAVPQSGILICPDAASAVWLVPASGPSR